MQRADSLEKTLMLGGIGGRRRRGQQRMRWLDSITDSMDVSLGELLRGSQAPRRAVCGTRGSLRTMHGPLGVVKWKGASSRGEAGTSGFLSTWRDWGQEEKGTTEDEMAG